MADFYPLILRAVSALDKNTDAERHAFYERARNALAQVLRSSKPAPTESEIVCECLALDQAIDRVEAPYAVLDTLTNLPPGTRAALRSAVELMRKIDKSSPPSGD